MHTKENVLYVRYATCIRCLIVVKLIPGLSAPANVVFLHECPFVVVVVYTFAIFTSMFHVHQASDLAEV